MFSHCSIQTSTPTPHIHSLPLTVSASDLPIRRDSTMSVSVLLMQYPQGQTSVLGPGIAGIFIQGIESGLVFAQFSQWFYGSDRSESRLLSTIVMCVTVVGLYASSRLFTVRPHYLFLFMKCAVQSMLCICLVSVCTALWGARTCLLFSHLLCW